MRFATMSAVQHFYKAARVCKTNTVAGTTWSLSAPGEELIALGLLCDVNPVFLAPLEQIVGCVSCPSCFLQARACCSISWVFRPEPASVRNRAADPLSLIRCLDVPEPAALSGGQPVEREIEQQDIHARLAQKTEEATLDMIADKLTQAIFRQVARFGDTGDLEVGSLGRDVRIEPAARRRVIRSAGTGADGFSCLSLSMSPCTRSISALLEGPRFDPPELAAL
jgi:hypothetical protein